MAWIVAVLIVSAGTLWWAARHWRQLRAGSMAVERASAALSRDLGKRAILTNRLIDVARGYAHHEQLARVAIARDGQPAPCPAAVDAATVKALDAVRFVAERFPELKENAGFSLLMAELQAAEDGLHHTRGALAEAVKRYSRLRGRFPASVFASQPGYPAAHTLSAGQNDVHDSIGRLARGTAPLKGMGSRHDPPTGERRADGAHTNQGR